MLITRRHLTGAIAAALGATLLAGAAHAEEVLKWAHVFEPSEPFHTEALWAADEIAKRTDGRYRIEVYPSSQLGKENDLDQGLKLGTVDMVTLTAGLAAKQYPPLGVTYYPYVFRDADHLLAFTKSEVYDRLTAGYEKKTGNHIAGTIYYGTRHTTANKPIESCADLAGIKMRVPNIPSYLAMPRACGANTAPIPFAEVYLALQNGTVDAEENPLTTIEAKKFYEVQDTIALTGHIVDQLNIVVSKGRWRSLSDEDKAIFAEVLQESAERASAAVVARENELIGFFRDKGLTVNEVDRASFEEAVHEKIGFEEFGYEEADWQAIRDIK